MLTAAAVHASGLALTVTARCAGAESEQCAQPDSIPARVRTPWGQSYSGVGGPSRIDVAIDWANTGVDPRSPSAGELVRRSWLIDIGVRDPEQPFTPSDADAQAVLTLIADALARQHAKLEQTLANLTIQIACSAPGGDVVPGRTAKVGCELVNPNPVAIAQLSYSIAVGTSVTAVSGPPELQPGERAALDFDVAIPKETVAGDTQVTITAAGAGRPPATTSVVVKVSARAARRACKGPPISRQQLADKDARLRALRDSGTLKPDEYARYRAELQACVKP